MSLVACYSSSEEDGEGQGEIEDEVKQEDDVTTSEEDNESSSSLSCQENPFNKLPLPGEIFNKKTAFSSYLDINKRKISENSVFSNSFAQTEATVQQTLSKHKKLSEISTNNNDKRHRKKTVRKEENDKTKLCMHFFKHGSCKYQDKCKYSHTLMKQPEKALSSQEVVQPDITHKQELYKKSTKKRKESYDDDDDGDDESAASKSKAKKRPGLGNDIVPGKKVLKAYDKTYK